MQGRPRVLWGLKDFARLLRLLPKLKVKLINQINFIYVFICIIHIFLNQKVQYIQFIPLNIFNLNILAKFVHSFKLK